jgi:hypothetical protein
MYNLYTQNDTPIDMTLDSTTTIQIPWTCFMGIKHWLLHLFPNTKHLILSYDVGLVKPSSDFSESMKRFDQYFRGKQTTTDRIISSEIEITITDINNFLHERVGKIVETLLKTFENLQIIRLYFYHILI